MKKLLFLLCVLLLAAPTVAQNSSGKKTGKNRPTIGLVLSGGGAKGFAHIGVIQLLEEVGIKPDYITGTSMGSIIGALYAMGYSVDEMRQISDTTDWEHVLSNDVPLTEVTVAEKPYYGTFLTELNISKQGVSLPGGLIEGQNLLEKLSILTQPVHGVENFLEFPIPFTCVATDIVKGIPVALNQGNITDAIRASMAIPTAFTPVEIDSLLLIDGGWTRNLPVQEAKDMGADIIISVDVGSGLKQKEDLQSLVSILDQTAWLLSVKDSEKQIEMSNYVVKPNVGMYSTFDFGNADTIIALGYEKAAEQREVFKALAQEIYPSGKSTKTIEKPNYVSNYKIEEILVSGNRLTSDKFVSGRLAIDPKKNYTTEQLSMKVGHLYGSLYYKKIGFQVIPKTDSTQTLRLNVVEDNPAKLKLSFYYDSENSIGLNFNMTLRNLVFKNSRLIVDAFVSENPIVGFKYLKHVGNNQRSFFYLESKFTLDSRYTWQNFYGKEAVYNYREILFRSGYAFTFANSWIFGTDIGINTARINPVTNPDSVVAKWKQEAVPVGIFVGCNTLDSPVFPSKGIKFIAEAYYNFEIFHRAILEDQFTPEDQENVNELIQVDPFVSLKLSYQQYIPLTKKLSLYTDANMSFPFNQNVGFNDYAKIGGIAPILYTGTPFYGLKRNEVFINQFASVSAGFQWNFLGKVYLKGKINYLNVEYPMRWVRPHEPEVYFELYGRQHNAIWGLGAELAYASAIGPVRLVVHHNQYSSHLDVFFGIGYNIFKSRGDF